MAHRSAPLAASAALAFSLIGGFAPGEAKALPTDPLEVPYHLMLNSDNDPPPKPVPQSKSDKIITLLYPAFAASLVIGLLATEEETRLKLRGSFRSIRRALGKKDNKLDNLKV
jgi:hypothetical protein